MLPHMLLCSPMPAIGAGLRAENGSLMGLTSVHVRGSVVDLVASCTLYQQYQNSSGYPVEAKYVFPLDESAAVCGFEAFVGQKHVVAQVKEKQEVRISLWRCLGCFDTMLAGTTGVQSSHGCR